MKKVIYFSTAALLLILPNVSNAQSSNDLTASEVFCLNTSASTGNAIIEINRMIDSRSSRITRNEKEILAEMAEILDDDDTVEDICSPAEF